MKTNLLVTTALVAVLSVANVHAETIIDQNTSGIFHDGEEPERNKYNLTAPDLASDNLIVNGNGNLTAYANNVDMEVGTGKTITLNQGKIHANGDGNGSTSLVISGGTINVNGPQTYENDVTFTGEGILMSGGTINLNGGSVSDDAGSGFTITGGNINMKTSEQSFAAIGSEGASGTVNIKGGTITVDGGIDVRNSQIQGSNFIQGSEINLSGGELNINSGANLKTFIAEDVRNKSTINLTDTGVINLAGGLLADVDGNGSLNFKNSNALVDGNVKGSNLSFDASHSLSNAISGTIGDLASLNVNGGFLNYDKQTGKITDLKIKDGAGLDIGTKTVNATSVDFADNSSLKFTVAGKEDGSFGKIKADTINISTTGTKLDLTLNSSVLGKDETKDFTILDGSVTGDFATLSENNRYEFEKVGNGVYKITGKETAGESVINSGGNANNAGTASAWDSVSLDNPSGSTQGTVANVLAELSNKTTTAAGKKAYVDALTALAPETNATVQSASTENANQVFSAVGTRLSGGSVSTGGEGMSSGDNFLQRGSMWVQGLFNKSKLDDTSKSKGFDADSTGIAFGAEKQITDDVKAGIGYAYTNTDIDGFMRSTDVDTHTAIAYGEYKPSNWYVNGIATYGWSDYSENKNVAGVGVKADYDVDTIGLQAMTGYDMNINGFGFTPEAGLRYVHISQDAYKDSSDQKVSANDSDILTGVIGAKINKDFALENGMSLRPEARLAMTYDLMNDDANSVVTLANGSAYSVNGEALDRFGVEVGASLTADVNDNVELNIGYEGKFRQDYQDHTGLLNAKYKF